jgi:DNA-binding transcriptional regulator GbsR (MarR family)
MNVRKNAKTEFAEQFGIFFEKVGFPRMAGRVWGYLLTCNPPEQTAEELSKAVQASRSSISTMTRLLIQLGLLERVGITGRRSGYYRVRSGGFTEILRAKMRFTTEVRRIAEHGLKLLKSEPPSVRKHLEEYRDLCIFFEKQFPMLIEKWERGRKKK